MLPRPPITLPICSSVFSTPKTSLHSLQPTRPHRISRWGLPMPRPPCRPRAGARLPTPPTPPSGLPGVPPTAWKAWKAGRAERGRARGGRAAPALAHPPITLPICSSVFSTPKTSLHSLQPTRPHRISRWGLPMPRPPCRPRAGARHPTPPTPPSGLPGSLRRRGRRGKPGAPSAVGRGEGVPPPPSRTLPGPAWAAGPPRIT